MARTIYSATERGSCGHAGFCAPKGDGQCDHVDGLGTSKGYTYRCLLVAAHTPGHHFHDLRPEARGWYERTWAEKPVIASGAIERARRAMRVIHMHAFVGTAELCGYCDDTMDDGLHTDKPDRSGIDPRLAAVARAIAGKPANFPARSLDAASLEAAKRVLALEG